MTCFLSRDVRIVSGSFQFHSPSHVSFISCWSADVGTAPVTESPTHEHLLYHNSLNILFASVGSVVVSFFRECPELLHRFEDRAVLAVWTKVGSEHSTASTPASEVGQKVLNLINSSLGKLPWLLQLPMVKTDGVPFLRILRDFRRLVASEIGCKMSVCSAVVLNSSVGQVPQPHDPFFLISLASCQQFNKANDGGFPYSVRSHSFEGDATIRVRTHVAPGQARKMDKVLAPYGKWSRPTCARSSNLPTTFFRQWIPDRDTSTP